MRTEAVNQALERTITRERLKKYLHKSEGDLDEALRLYELNTHLAEAFFPPLQCVEVCLRNSLNDCMTNAYGPRWFQNGNAPLNTEARRMVGDAYRELIHVPEPVSDGKVVAELKFAFWVSLLGPGYDATIWRKVLYRAFRTGGGRRRSEVHGRFNAIRRFRNRVAHHEPIFHRPIQRLHDEMIEGIDWMCRDTSKWAAHHSRVPEILNSN